MVIKPYGFAIRENIKKYLDQMFKNTGHSNAYFPLFIPKSYLSKEADHVEWFAKECAVVTHHRLMNNPDGPGVVVDPSAKLEEELIVRPTSETVIWRTYKDWIQSHRDLPLLINQRANVVRREMRTRVFLRTAEFLRQEGHTAHATEKEAIEEAKLMHEVYDDLMRNFLAIYGVKWVKSESERFAGAEETYTIEAMMQDGKALQSCTSHYLGTNFWDAFDVKFRDEKNEEKSVYATSRWMSTRIMWALIMSHSDDKWLILPPAVAPIHIVIVPIYKKWEDDSKLDNFVMSKIIAPLINGKWTKVPISKLELSTNEYTTDELYQFWESENYNKWKMIIKNEEWVALWYASELKLKYDTSDKSPWRKFSERELKWVPLRIAVWFRDMENWIVEIARRDESEKHLVKIEELKSYVTDNLKDIQISLLKKSMDRIDKNSTEVNTRDEFIFAIDENKFVMAHRDGTTETEELIQQETKATIRCIPLDNKLEDWVCIKTGKPSKQRVLFAKAY